MVTTKKKLLLVDDAELFLKSFERLLVKEGYEITTASNGLEGIECIRKNDFDLVVTDIEMPKMDGFEMLRKIQKFKRELVVIVLTAFGSLEKEEKAMFLGASKYIEKPVEIDYIKEIIKDALKGV